MADFAKAMRKVLQHEGVKFIGDIPDPNHTGYSNHVDDPGGITNYGVTRRVARDNGYTGDMRELPYIKVLEIYEKKYWKLVGGHLIEDQAIAERCLTRE